MSSAPASNPAPATLDPLLGPGSSTLDSHAESTATISPYRRNLRRDARPKSSKHSPLLRDLNMRSMLRNFNPNSPALSATSTEFFTLNNFDLPSSFAMMPPMLSPPESFGNVERILHLIQIYASGFFDARTWPLHCSLSTCALTSHDRCVMIERGLNAMNNFYSLHVAVHRMMRSPSSESLSSTYDLVGRAHDNFRPMIEAQHHNTLVQIFSVIALFDSPGPLFDYLMTGLKFFGQMAATVLGHDHSITAIVRALLTVGESAITNAIALAWEVLAARFEQNLGVAHHVSLTCRLRMIESIFIKPGTLQNAERLLTELSDMATTGRGPQDIHSVSIEYSLARLLLHQGQPAKCMAVASRVMNRCWEAQKDDEYAAAALESAALQLVATAQCRMGQHALAESSLRHSVQIRASKWGLQSPLLLHALLSLEEFLTAAQKEKEAAEVKRQRFNIMSQSKDTG